MMLTNAKAQHVCFSSFSNAASLFQAQRMCSDLERSRSRSPTHHRNLVAAVQILTFLELKPNSLSIKPLKNGGIPTVDTQWRTAFPIRQKQTRGTINVHPNHRFTAHDLPRNSNEPMTAFGTNLNTSAVNRNVKYTSTRIIKTGRCKHHRGDAQYECDCESSSQNIHE